MINGDFSNNGYGCSVPWWLDQVIVHRRALEGGNIWVVEDDDAGTFAVAGTVAARIEAV